MNHKNTTDIHIELDDAPRTADVQPPRRSSGRARAVTRSVLATTALFSLLSSATAHASSDRGNHKGKLSLEGRHETKWDELDREVEGEEDGTLAVIVTLRPPADIPAVDRSDPAAEKAFTRQRDSLMANFHGKQLRALRTMDGAPFVTMHVDRDDIEVLRSSPEVESVVIDTVSTTDATSPFGADAGQQLPSFWDYSRIGADWANNNGWTGKGTKIAIIDSGVDRNNPYLAGRLVNEACFATNDDGTGACNNNLTSQYSTAAAGVAGAASPCTYTQMCAHGTHVAHTAAGAYGVARGASIVAIRTSHRGWDAKSNSYQPLHSSGDIAWALWYVDSVLPKAGIVVAAVNVSIGGGVSPTTCDNQVPIVTSYITHLRNTLKIPTVISSGNDNASAGVTWPACISTAVVVGNTTMTAATGGLDAVFGNVSVGSNSSSLVDLLAPGTDICSAFPVGLDNDGRADGWRCDWTGTSMAAPHVAGAIAVLTQKRPTATVDQFVAALQKAGATGGVTVTDSRNGLSRTRINVANAVYYNI